MDYYLLDAADDSDDGGNDDCGRNPDEGDEEEKNENGDGCELVQQGVKAAYINRSLTDAQYDKVLKNAAFGIYKIIYVAPERMDSVSFINLCRRIKISISPVFMFFSPFLL